MPNTPTSEVFNLFYHLISPYPYFFSHPTSYHSTQQHFKFIFGDQLPLLLLILVPAVIGQIPELFTAPILPVTNFIWTITPGILDRFQ